MSLSGLLPPNLGGNSPNADGNLTPEEKAALQQAKIIGYMNRISESCVFKSSMAGVLGFGLGGIFGMFISSLDLQHIDPKIYEKPFREQIRIQARDMGSRSFSTAKNFGLLGLIYSGSECCIEAFRAKTDIYNAIAAGVFTGGALAVRSGPKAIVLGGAGFGLFSYGIEKYMHWGE
ncbi:Mitochondrial import inner membrane translocase subunit tim22 [Schizosaccharomyces pombe]|uniref:Mitochondrial import inner membrane translocase subunit tim22 n=1 Tax=Schizosaccharomyces pombe (strain 972 / ATCC 24843) TaxID=284812 RepID=TIM22_SCHPO|nr:putative TIM22 inner membrane protein import complex subunit Tim22 [Schizosaccharomyces pombe]P87146.1 RecName: Full=Mitochondrial import inner membrane translocase subunit tim22 [Schizosaccharomyces pombe 972h-]CAB08780.1 TIM22 inner membrane protein import complex subunit Tim22 (predicted) [Schizosaccharomyces pombe]|eukprot:NP_596362.1 putative TIM22 inner membrane protein import complex subunit Tim22 [Schizosaccharomyces pombe]